MMITSYQIPPQSIHRSFLSRQTRRPSRQSWTWPPESQNTTPGLAIAWRL